jgi:hypothetical protein
MAKQFAWSFSKLKSYETCPRKFHEQDVLKNFQEGDSEQLIWGNQVHQTLAKVLEGKLPELPPEMEMFQKYVDLVNKLPGNLQVEQKYAITKDFGPTTYFAPNCWYRGIGDVVKVGDTRAVILDWKTGAIKVDSVQLMLMALCIFAHFPKVQKVHTGFIWLKEDAVTMEEYDRADVADCWTGLLGRVTDLEAALKTGNFPPKPSGLCRKWCPVSSCEFHGKGAF